MPPIETVDFMHTESGDDLIVAFAIASDTPGEIISLSLLRTPKFEPLLDPEERGVNISREDIPGSDRDMLRSIRWDGTVLQITTTEGRRYVLDVRRVEEDEIRRAEQILARMNFDHAFTMEPPDKHGKRGRSTFRA